VVSKRKKENTPDSLRDLQRSIAETVKQTRLAYQFCPGSYTAWALNACLLAEKRLATVRNQITLAAAPSSSSSTARVARRPTPTEPGADPQPAGMKKAGPKALPVAGNYRKKNRGQV